MAETPASAEGMRRRVAEGRLALVAPQRFRAETPTGLAVEGDYAVVSARDLIASHDTALRVDPRYPEIRQPRMRDKAASRQQLENFVQNTRVEALGRSDDTARGAPIVDGLEVDRFGGYVVDSGNMRAIGIKQLYELGHPNADRYRAFVLQEAAALGLRPEDVARIPDPVLVRVRRTPVDVVRFNREANLGTQLKMSAVEVARADAQQLDDDLMRLFAASETGEVATAANRDFIARFIRKVAPIPEERGDLLLPDGTLTRQGIQRIQNAVLAKAYGDVTALEKLIESPDLNVRNIANAMLVAAPRLIELQGKIARGERYPLDIGRDVAQTMNLLSRLREEGTPVKLYIQQTRLFGEEAAPEVLHLLEVFDANKASRKKIVEFLTAYADMAEAVGDPKQVQLVARDVPTKLDLIRRAAELARDRPTAMVDLLEAMRAETAGRVARQQEAGAVRLPTFMQAAAGPGVRSADPAVDAVESARLRPADFLAGVRRWWNRFVERAVDPLVYEPLLRDRPDLRNRFRLLKAVPAQAVDFGRGAVFAIRGDLGPEEYEVFRRWILMKTFQQDLAAGLRVPGGLTEAQVGARLAELESRFTPAVRAAIDRHRAATKALAADLVQRGILPAEALDTEIYFPHRVLDYQQVFGDWIGLPRRLRAPYRSYVRQRKGTVSLVNTDYDQVMAEHFGQVYVHNRLDDFWRSVATQENVLGRLSRQQKAQLFGTETRTLRGRQVQVVRQPLPNRVYVIDGKEYVGFQYEPGRQLYPAMTTTEKLTAALLNGTLNADEYARRVRQGLAIGRRKPVVLLPRAVYERLMRFKQPYVPLPVLDQIAGFTNLWKRVTLNLAVPASYNINNEIGDFLGSIAREIPWQELWKELPRIYWYRLQATAPVFKRVVRGKPLAELGPEWERILRLAEENDVIASGLAAGETRAADMLRLLNPMALTQAFAEVQEASRRAGYYKWLLERSARGQPLALSVPATELAQLRGAGEAAGYVARTVLVDYQATSPTFRRFVNNLAFPFATWYAYNFINYAKYVRRNPADALVKLLVPYVGMQLWNNTVWGDVEKDLPLYYRLMPHIVTGRTDADGKHIVIVFQHPAHFAAQLVGLDRLGDNVRRLRAGELTLEEFAYQQLKDTALGTPRMMWRFLNPIAKIGLVIGQYVSGSGNVKDIVTRRVIVPERLRGTPEAFDRLMGYALEQIVVPLAQVYRAGREDDPPPGWAAQWAKEALDLERAAGIRRIDVDRAAQFRRRDWQEQLEAIRASALDKLEQAYIRASVERDRAVYERGAQEAHAWYRSEIARAWRQMGGRGTPPPVAFRPEEVQSRLSSTRVRIAITREMLRRERDPERRRRLFAALEALDRKAADEARKRAPKGIRDLVPTPIPTR